MSRKFLVPLVLPADPANPLEAATKQYVDNVADEIHIGATAPADTTKLWADTTEDGVGGFSTMGWLAPTTDWNTVLADGIYTAETDVGTPNGPPLTGITYGVLMVVTTAFGTGGQSDGFRYKSQIYHSAGYSAVRNAYDDGTLVWEPWRVFLNRGEGGGGDGTVTPKSREDIEVVDDDAWLINPGVVRNDTLAPMGPNSIKGNNTGGTANAADLTVAQVKALLAIASGDVSGLGVLATASVPITVAQGGSGRATATTAHSLIAGGTTATGAQQSIAPAASGFLKSTSTTALPGWAALTGADLAADSVTNTQLQPMATLTIKGNSTGATAGPQDLTAAQVKTLLGIDNITVASSAPGSPAVNDLWVDTT